MVGAGRFERPTPCAQGIGCPHSGINRFNNLRTLLVGPCGNFSYNLDCKAAIRLVKPPPTPTGSPAGSADCEINQRGRAYVVTAGSLEGPSIAGFKLGDPLLLRQVVEPQERSVLAEAALCHPATVAGCQRAYPLKPPTI